MVDEKPTEEKPIVVEKKEDEVSTTGKQMSKINCIGDICYDPVKKRITVKLNGDCPDDVALGVLTGVGMGAEIRFKKERRKDEEDD